jgi:hypothetical protein
VSASARSRTIPSKIPVTHLPEWEQPFLRHNHRLPTGPSWLPESVPDITVGLTSKQDGDTTLYAWYIPFAGEPLLSGSGKLPESPTPFPPRALLGTPVALYSALRCLQLLISPALWSTINRHSSPDPRHPSIHSPIPFSSTVTTRHAAALHSSSGKCSSAVSFSTWNSPSSHLQT